MDAFFALPASCSSLISSKAGAYPVQGIERVN